MGLVTHGVARRADVRNGVRLGVRGPSRSGKAPICSKQGAVGWHLLYKDLKRVRYRAFLGRVRTVWRAIGWHP